MTDLGLTKWQGVDDAGALMVMFGGIDTGADPDEMYWERLNPKGERVGFGKALRIDDTSFQLSSVEGNVGKFVGDFVENATISYVITSTTLELTQGGVTRNLEQV